MSRIRMKEPLVEIDGDEMARVMWGMVKKKLLVPYVDLKTEYYDLNVKRRDETDDNVTIQSAEAIKNYGVGVKCATITSNLARLKEYGLKKQWESPNATIRRLLDGTIFRTPIVLDNIKPAIRFWKKPIIIGRHAYGDLYNNVEHRVLDQGLAELVFTVKNGNETRLPVHVFKGPGIIQAIHNIDRSIESFARTCYAYALDQKVDLWFAAKDTISKTYDARFKEIFNQIYDEEFENKFARESLKYCYMLIDDAMARIMRSDGGILWACKNYDGDVMSDFLGAAYGSLAVMTSVLVSPSGCFEFEAAHGTVQRHYYKYLRGEKTSTNPTAIIFAWTGSLRKRAELDCIPELVQFTNRLEKAVRETIEVERIMTQDLAEISDPPAKKIVATEEFIDAVDDRITKLQQS